MIKTDIIRHAVASACISGNIKLFLFGIDRREASRIGRPRNGDGSRRQRMSRASFEQIEMRLERWASHQADSSRNPSLSELAKDINVEKSALLSYFSRYLKKDFRSWKSSLRISRARVMLLDEDSPLDIDIISRHLGFSNKSNFHRQFKQHTGCTPGQWKSSGGHPELYGGNSGDAAEAMTADEPDAEDPAPPSQD